MYELYYLQGACSVATQVVLHELGQKVKIIDKQHVKDFKAINSIGTVPVLVDGDSTLIEGAAIMLHILKKHKNSLLPENGDARQKAIQDIMFANATMHPAYGKLFFIEQNINDDKVKQQVFNSAAESISLLWQVVENELDDKSFLGGDNPSAADIMLTVYSRWGASFPVDIVLGEKTSKMLNAVQAMPNFKKADEAEQAVSAK